MNGLFEKSRENKQAKICTNLKETVQNSRKKDEKVCYEGGVHTKRTEDDGTNVEHILQIIVSPTQKLIESERTARNSL